MSEAEPIRDDTLRSAKAAALFGLAFTIAALGIYGTRTALSVSAGAVIAISNLLTMRAIIRALLGTDGQAGGEKNARAGAVWGVLAVVKMLVLFAALGFLLTRRLVDPIPLVVGYGVMPLGIVASALLPARD